MQHRSLPVAGFFLPPPPPHLRAVSLTSLHQRAIPGDLCALLCSISPPPPAPRRRNHRCRTQGVDGAKTEYRVWNPFRSKLAAAILGGVENIWIVPGAKVLYLGGASGTSVSHVSDLVGPVSCGCGGGGGQR
jgi:hypothetical protein